MEWHLMRTYDSKDEAEADLKRYAQAVREVWNTDRYGVAVRRMEGTWGIWLRDRDPER